MAAILGAGKAARGEALSALAERPGIEGGILILPPEPGEDLIHLRDRGFSFWWRTRVPGRRATSSPCPPPTSPVPAA